MYYANEFNKDFNELRKLTLRDPSAFAWKENAKITTSLSNNNDVSEE